MTGEERLKRRREDWKVNERKKYDRREEERIL